MGLVDTGVVTLLIRYKSIGSIVYLMVSLVGAVGAGGAPLLSGMLSGAWCGSWPVRVSCIEACTQFTFRN